MALESGRRDEPRRPPAHADGDDVASRVLAWFDQHARALPWRASRDPYRVWVSEIMLQQTRVETVIPYYERWLARFPDVRALAAASEEAVLKAWEGLGYYRRARNLHRAARIVVERHGASLPGDFDALRALPGIGEYTAGAIASIAFGVRVPVVDGNVRRVLSRLHDLPDPTPSVLRGLAAALVPETRPGDFNQGLMELGSTVCLPRAPACDRCPLAGSCLARARGTRLERPAARRARDIPEVDIACAVLFSHDGRLLLVRRPDGGLLGGMWAFPETELRAGETPADAALRLAAELTGEPGAWVVEEEPLTTVHHAFSHRLVRYHPVRLRPAEGRPGAAAPEGTGRLAEARAGYGAADAAAPADLASSGWLTPDEATRLPLPVAQRKILAALG